MKRLELFNRILKSMERYSRVISVKEEKSCFDTIYHVYECEDATDEFGYTLPNIKVVSDNNDTIISLRWQKDGLVHRDERDRQDGCENDKTLPAVINSNGSREWYKKGKLHRNDRDENGRVLPAAVNYSRINDEKCIESQEWYRNGKKHRDDRDENGRVLPAHIWGVSTREWWINGKLHRDDRDENGTLLPAIMDNYGDKTIFIDDDTFSDSAKETGYYGNVNWYLNGVELSSSVSKNGTWTIGESTICPT